MFDLEKAINEWEKNLRHNPGFEDGDIAELESHLRERTEILESEGLSQKAAFEKACEEIGGVGQLQKEWDKTRFSSASKQQKFLVRQSLLTLLPSYITTAFRNIKKRFGYSIINILGLSTGLTTCILIFLFVGHELSYDSFHKDKERIYRVINSTSEDRIPTNANGSFGAGPLLKKDYPDEVEAYGRIRRTAHNSEIYVAHNENKFYEEHFYFADSGFIHLFSFPVLKGDAATALKQPNTLLLTETMARKYFGEEDPVGKILTADPYQDGNLMDFEITGVLKDLPSNTHFDFDFLASYSSQTNEGLNTSLAGFNGNFTYIKLSPSAMPEQLEAKFDEFQKNNWTDNPWYTMSLQPMQDIHLHSHLKSEIAANGNITYVYIFGAVALLILGIACINFINLSTARSTERAKEVGLRKVMGAYRGQLVWQFLGEALVMTFLSGLVALLLLYFFLPLFNNLTQKSFEFAGLLSPENISVYVLLLTLIGLLAGFYPALLLSSFRSAEVLKSSNPRMAGGSLLRKVLVVSQFAISSILIISTIIIYQQVEFIKNKSLGYAREQILTIPLNPEAREHFEVMKSEWTRHSGVLNVTSSSHVPTSGTSHTSFQVSGVEGSLSMARFYVDEDFMETYDLNLLAGTDISTMITEPGKADFLATELAVSEAGLDNPEELVGRAVNWDEYSGSIKGVVNDMILYDLRQELYSIMFFITPVQYHKFASVRINTSQTNEVLSHIEEVWDSQVSSYPLEYAFLDDKFEEMHTSDQKMAQTITYFALLAVFIACLGLFGLAAYMAERRQKEIGVRKVLGATIPGIIRLLSVDFLKLVLVALCIGVPIAYYGISRWLQGFVYKTEIGAPAFILAALLLIAITLLSISYQSVKSATMNPVNSLKNE